MGTRMAPSYANLFMGRFEQHAIANALHKPLIWWRFIDDIFLIWTEGEEHLKHFISHLNSIHPYIKFTHEYSNSPHQTLPFLDVQVHLGNNHTETDLHTKPTDKHQYLLKTSCHPSHTKQTIPFSLFLRIRRICSNDAFFDNRSEELIKHLIKRGYSRKIQQRDANRVRAIPRHATLQSQEQKTTKADRTPFVISFNPALPKISSVVKKHITILQSSTNCKNAFPHPPVIAYKRNASLRELLVHSEGTKRRPPQNRLEITLKWFERDYRPTQKQETTRFAVLNEFDQGLRFLHNPTKCTKRRPPQNRLEITSNWFERDCGPKQKRETARFAFINKFDQGLRFVHNPTKCTKRRPPQNRLEITSNWFERDCGPKQKRETARFAVINKFDKGLRFVHNQMYKTKTPSTSS